METGLDFLDADADELFTDSPKEGRPARSTNEMRN
jgi:hypothetical protein